MNNSSGSVSALAVTLGAGIVYKGYCDVRQEKPKLGCLEQVVGAGFIIAGVVGYYFFAEQQDGFYCRPVPENTTLADGEVYGHCYYPYSEYPHGYRDVNHVTGLPCPNVIMDYERLREKGFHRYDVCERGLIDLVKTVGQEVWTCYISGMLGCRNITQIR